MKNQNNIRVFRQISLITLSIFGLQTLVSAQTPTINEVFISPTFESNQNISFTVLASNFGEVNLNVIEYSFDSDPGPGNAAGDQIVQFSPADPATVAILAETAGLTAGPHTLIVYVRSINGVYSLPVQRSFEIRPPIDSDPLIVAYEYAFDVDPGIGNASIMDVAQPVTPLEVDLVIEIPVALDPGPHTLLLRFQDEFGSWGATYYHDFNNIPPLDPSVVDFNGDGVINVQDLMLLIAAYPCNADCIIDANGDGLTDTNDLLLLFAFFGQTY